MSSPEVDRRSVGAMPTHRTNGDRPHVGNVFEPLYRRRALQIEPAA